MFSAFRSKSAYQYLTPLAGSSIDELYDLASKNQSKESRVDTIKSLSQFVVEKGVAVPLAERYYVRYFNPETVESLGSQPQPLNLLVKNIVPRKATSP